MVNRDTEDFNNEYCDSDENRARVVKLLTAKGLPKDGWYCDYWEDMGDADNRCELCGIERVRYVHHMQNVITNDHLAVGCYCAGGMENDLPAAIERERSNVNRLKRRARFRDKRWLEGGPERETHLDSGLQGIPAEDHEKHVRMVWLQDRRMELVLELFQDIRFRKGCHVR